MLPMFIGGGNDSITEFKIVIPRVLTPRFILNREHVVLRWFI